MRLSSHFLTMGCGWLSRGVYGVIQLVSIPILLHALGNTAFAIFLILTGLTPWFIMMDLGVGSSLQNELSRQRVEAGNLSPILKAVGVPILAIGVVESLLFACIAGFLQSLLLKKMAFTSNEHLFLVTGLFFIWYGVLSVANKVFFARQQGYFGYLYQTLGYSSALGVVGVLSFFHPAGGLFIACVGWVGAQTFWALVSYFHAFFWRQQCSLGDWVVFKRIFLAGIPFGTFFLFANLVLAMDYILMSQILEDNDIIIYSIFSKIFMFAYFGYTAMNAAIWPILTESFTRKNLEEMLKTNAMLIKNVILAIIFVAMITLVIFFFRDWLMELFSLTAFKTSGVVIGLFGVYYIVRVVADTYGVVLQSLGKTRVFLVVVPIHGLINFILAITLTRLWGINGFMLALTFSFLLTVFWLWPALYYKKFLPALLNEGR